MRTTFVTLLIAALFTTLGFAQTRDSQRLSTQQAELPAKNLPKVFLYKEISPENLVKIYEALGREAKGNVAVKLSTGEPGGNNFLQPALIKDLVQKVNGTIVECNTAYGGSGFN